MLKFPITPIIGNLQQRPATLGRRRTIWGYFWGYSVIDCTTIPIKINRLRHLFDCLLNNPSCAACWQWCVQQRQRVTGAITGNRVGSKSTRQGDGQACLLACLQFQKARQALPTLLADISGFWQGRGVRPENALNQKVIKL